METAACLLKLYAIENSKPKDNEQKSFVCVCL